MSEEEKNNYIKPIGETLQDKINYYQNKVFELNKLLEKEDAVIDKMAEHIEKGCDFDNRIQTKRQILEYFTNLVEKEE